MSEIRLNKVMIGLGNPVHEQFHRTNRIDITADLANRAAQERFAGGITPNTISQIGIMSGNLSSQHSGLINVEGGWNQRRGLAMLQMTVVENSLVENTLSVLGYLYGGSMEIMGQIPGDVIFVPVRSWTMSVESTQDAMYMPTVKRGVTESSQFLMADPDMVRELRSIRPVDVITHGFGLQSSEEEDDNIQYAGSTGADLGANGVIVSKTSNLNPITNAQSIMGHAARVARSQVTHNLLSENMAASMGGLSEQEIFEHPFLSLMMSSLNMPNYAGFVGFSFEELRQVFQGFDSVVAERSDRGVETQNHMLDSNPVSGADYHTKIANELAFISMHSLIDAGLLFLEFTASNNVSNMGINAGGIFFQEGAAAGILPNDPHMYNRVMQFKDYLEHTFFQKYSTRVFSTSTVLEVKVTMNLFGECRVSLTMNGNYADERNFVFPSYTINRTSSNIASDEIQQAMATAYVDNLKEYFVK